MYHTVMEWLGRRRLGVLLLLFLLASVVAHVVIALIVAIIWNIAKELA